MIVMSLNWDIGKCRDWEELNSEEEWGTTQNLIFSMGVAGFHSVTEDNWPKVYARITNWGRLADPGGDDMFTPEDIERRVGLSTNCWPDLTDKKWIAEKLCHVLGLDNMAHNARRRVEKALEVDDAE